MKLTASWLLLAATLLAACDSAPPPAAVEPVGAGVAPSRPAVHVIFNARIHTSDPRRPAADTLVWDDTGRILAVGEAAVAEAWPDADRRDLQGAALVPGLIDAHAHLSGLAAGFMQADLVGAKSKQEVLERLAVQEAKLGPDDWLLGRGWDQNDWPEQVFPTRDDLDERFPERPVWLRRIDGHAGWANSAALATADRDLSGAWQPTGGLVHRDADGRATGVLVDHAMNLVDDQVPEPSEAMLRDALQVAIAHMLSLGLTGVHDAGAGRSEIERFAQLIEAGQFDTRVYAMTDGVGATLDWLCERGAIDHPSGRLVVRSVKLYADGALGSRGAALLADYADDPGNRGLLFLEPEALETQVRKAMGCGFQVGVHAIGDGANREALDAYQRVAGEYPDNPGRHRVEHAQILDAADVPRFAELGVIASVQPTHATSDMYWAGQRLGENRLRYAYAWRSLLDSGARLALGSDFPVEHANPLLGLYAAVSRRDLEGWPEDGWQPQERLARAEALRGFTLDAAWAAFMEDRVGSLEAGKRADFVILDRDIMTVPEEQIAHAVVLETWLDGRRVFLRNP